MGSCLSYLYAIVFVYFFLSFFGMHVRNRKETTPTNVLTQNLHLDLYIAIFITGDFFCAAVCELLSSSAASEVSAMMSEGPVSAGLAPRLLLLPPQTRIEMGNLGNAIQTVVAAVGC